MNRILRVFKALDVLGQLACIALPVLFSFIIKGQISSGVFSILFFLSVWQFFSVLIHLPFLRCAWISVARKIYLGLMLAEIAFLLIALVNQNIMLYFLYSMFYIGVILGALYLLLSITEWQNVQRLPREVESNFTPN